MLPKVLQLGKFYPPDIGGIENVMQDICTGINARGLVCDVLCSNSSYTFSYEISGSARVYRTKSFGKLASTSITPQMIPTLQKLIQAYDIIHIHLPDPMANLALFLSNSASKIVIIHWHSDIIKQKNLLKLYAPLQSWLLRRADCIIATSSKYIRESSVLQAYKDKCVSIPIGIDSIDSSIAPARNTRGKKVIFALGRLVAYKGFTYAIEAMSLLPQYHLHIGGTGALQRTLQRQINALGLQTRVKLLGALTQQERLLQFRDAYIFLLPSITKNEAFGIVQIEAMSQGLPVVSCSISGSGVDYVNAHNISGLVVPPRDPQAIAQAIMQIDGDYARFSRGARARFIAHFTRDQMLDSIYNLYTTIHTRKLLGGGAALARIYASLDATAHHHTTKRYYCFIHCFLPYFLFSPSPLVADSTIDSSDSIAIPRKQEHKPQPQNPKATESRSYVA